MSSLFRNIERQINQYRIDNGLREDAYCYIDSWWININSRNSTNGLHVHPFSFFSGVYYVKCDPELHSGISFETPLKVKDTLWTSDIVPNENQEFNSFTARTWTYPPELGKLLIFPSWLEHCVGDNNTDDIRVSISFNVLARVNYENRKCRK